MNAFFPPDLLQQLMQGQMMQGHPQPGEEVPARVRVALEFLSCLSVKTMKRGMVNDMGFDAIDGQKLTVEEETAQATACNLLSAYFRGKLRPSQSEHLVLDAMEAKEAHQRPDSAGMLMRCFNCAPNPPQPSCPFCRGLGELIIYPKGG